MLANADDETVRALVKHGSIDQWPTLKLAPKEFKLCTCGCARVRHKMIGTDRAACTECKSCLMFCGQFTAADRRRIGRSGGTER